MTSAQLWSLVLAVACGVALFLLGWQCCAQVREWRAAENDARPADDMPVPYRLSRAGWLEMRPDDPWVTHQGGPWYGGTVLPDPMDMAAAGYQLGQQRAERDEIGRQVDAMMLEYDTQCPRPGPLTYIGGQR